MLPQLGFAGPSPNPKKLKPDSMSTASETSSVASTISTDAAFGSKCLKSMRRVLIPNADAASMYSSDFTLVIFAREIRAASSQVVALITATTVTIGKSPKL
jgi:hypothetical protein